MSLSCISANTFISKHFAFPLTLHPPTAAGFLPENPQQWVTGGMRARGAQPHPRVGCTGFMQPLKPISSQNVPQHRSGPAGSAASLEIFAPPNTLLVAICDHDIAIGRGFQNLKALNTAHLTRYRASYGRYILENHLPN